MPERTYRGVPAPLGPTTAAWTKGVDAALALVRPIIDNLSKGGPCSLDHHGYCQAHWYGGVTECPEAVAQEFLRESRPPEEATVWQSEGLTFLVWCREHRPQGLTVTEVVLADVQEGLRLVCVQCARRLR